MRNLYFLCCFLLISGTIGLFSHHLDIESFSVRTEKKDLYAVQLAALKFPVYLNYFKGVENVVEMVGKEGMYRYCLKPFSGEEEALRLCEEMKKSGYPEAKVVRLADAFDSKALGDATQNTGDSKVGEVRVTQSDLELEKIRKSHEPEDAQQHVASAAEKALEQMSGVGSDYFYSIELASVTESLAPNDFYGLRNVKEFKEPQGGFKYLHGNFADVEDAEKYLKEQVVGRFPKARVVVVDHGKVIVPGAPQVSSYRIVAVEKDPAILQGLKRKGRAYVDYYYDDASIVAKVASGTYAIEVGPFEDTVQAQSHLDKLKNLGYISARLVRQKVGDQKVNQSKPARTTSNGNWYSIQIHAARVPKNTSSFKFSDVKQSFSQSDGLYRYFYGEYDNYWVCRRQLREVRNKGYKDAFIVKHGEK